MSTSNAIVSIVGAYAGMLADAEHEAERNGRAIAELADQIGRDAAERAAERENRDYWEDKARQNESAAAEVLRLQDVCDVRAREIVRLRDAIILALSYGSMSGGPLQALKEVTDGKAHVE